MKIIKYRFPRLSRRSSVPAQLPPPLRKKALLIGIRTVRDAVEETQDTLKRLPEDREQDDVKVDSKPKKKREHRDKGARKEPALKGPHRDVLDMKQLLIGALCPDILLSRLQHSYG
jgi:hypothetical protein